MELVINFYVSVQERKRHYCVEKCEYLNVNVSLPLVDIFFATDGLIRYLFLL